MATFEAVLGSICAAPPKASARETLELSARPEHPGPLDLPFKPHAGIPQRPRPDGLAEIFEGTAVRSAGIDHEIAMYRRSPFAVSRFLAPACSIAPNYVQDQPLQRPQPSLEARNHRLHRPLRFKRGYVESKPRIVGEQRQE
jgi:hypothetical protein